MAGVLTAPGVDTRCPSCFDRSAGGAPGAAGAAFVPGAACAVCVPCTTLVRARGAIPLGARVISARYQLGRVLGKPGGFGITYLGWDLQLARRVAVKEFFPTTLAARCAGGTAVEVLAADERRDFEAGLRGFLEEARTLAACQHDGVVAVSDFAEDNGTAYIVMLYYDGQTLDAYLRERGGRLPWREATGIALAVLDGLESVHAAGLIHRDIKPQNIYLARGPRGDARPIVIDFGAARRLAASRKLTIVLSEEFAPLEQYNVGFEQGPWTDVYAVAATLYAMVTGSPPTPAIRRIDSAALSPAHALAPGVPAGLSEVLANGLAMDVTVRPGTARVFATELRRVLAGAPIGALTGALTGAAAPTAPAERARARPSAPTQRIAESFRVRRAGVGHGAGQGAATGAEPRAARSRAFTLVGAAVLLFVVGAGVKSRLARAAGAKSPAPLATGATDAVTGGEAAVIQKQPESGAFAQSMPAYSADSAASREAGGLAELRQSLQIAKVFYDNQSYAQAASAAKVVAVNAALYARQFPDNRQFSSMARDAGDLQTNAAQHCAVVDRDARRDAGRSGAVGGCSP